VTNDKKEKGKRGFRGKRKIAGYRFEYGKIPLYCRKRGRTQRYFLVTVNQRCCKGKVQR